MKKVIILGCTGSIGTQTIDVIKHHQDKFKIVGISGGKNIALLEEILTNINVSHVCVSNASDMLLLKEKYSEIKFYCGEDGLLSLIEVDADIVVNALVGFIGLKPSLKTIETKKVLALANKESLVVGGDIVKQYLDRYDGTMYPIDSEHSAIFQALQGNKNSEIAKLVISASGGSFRDLTREQLVDVTVEQALAHPNWSMGSRITIDSATMMNKGFEVIEAKWLFGVQPSQIEVVVHPQSVIHSMVQFEDGAVKAQLGMPDMRLPIQYAFSYPDRICSSFDRLDFAKCTNLTFEQPDTKRFRNLALAYEAMYRGGNMPCIVNAANEVVVASFLKDGISFLGMSDVIEKTMERVSFVSTPTYDDYVATDAEARRIAASLIR